MLKLKDFYDHEYNVSGVINNFHVESVFTLINAGFLLELKVFTLKHEDVYISEPHVRFLRNLPHCLNDFTL
jgi:hypothetical protein